MKENYREKLWFLRRPTQVAVDLVVMTVAFFLAYLPAINIQLGEFYFNTALSQLPLVILVQFSALFLTGAYSILWRYISIEDLKVFLWAAAISGAVLILFRFSLSFAEFPLWQVPISVILIDTVLAFGGLLALRISRRFIYELGEKRTLLVPHRRMKRKPALVVGAGRTGAALAKEVVGRSDSRLLLRGFVDDDRRKQGGSVSGIKILGTTHDLPRLVEELDVEEVVIAIDQGNGKDLRRILEICRSIPVKAQMIPNLNEIAQGKISINRIRDVEIEDLLGRDPVKLDESNLHEFLSGKVVMVTGAGGSIGSELVRQIARFKPEEVLLVERAEFNLFTIEREARIDLPELRTRPLLADAGDEARMRELFERHRPAVVFHAAAHKHVPMMEANPIEAVTNNIFATLNVASLAGEFGASHFVLISTDKAVNPTSVMGASKRVAEIVVQNLSRQYKTRYTSVRFGNVLGSAGSVVPIFREQIRRGEPITVTHPDMTRYFMTIPEASQLVLQAGALGEGGEIFILDMGQPVRIVDLAEEMIRLSGLIPYEDIDIVFTGTRKGEKLFEELEITGENLLKTRHPKIFIGKIAAYSQEQVAEIVERFRRSVELRNESEIRSVLSDVLPEASLSGTNAAEGEPESDAETGKAFAQPGKLGLAGK